MKTHIFKYDLDLDMRPAKGELRFDESGRVCAVLDGANVRELSAGRVEQAQVTAGVGCGLIFVKLKDTGDELILCRFTMSALKQAGEFCKIVNYYVQTNTAAIPDEEEARVCPKCGRPMVDNMSACLFCFNKIGVLKRVAGLLRPHARKILLSEFFIAVAWGIYLLVPICNRYLIDRHLRPMTGTLGQVVMLAGAMLLARGLGEVIFIFSSRVFNKAGIRFSNDLRTKAYEKIQNLSMNSLAKHTPGDLIRRVMEDTETVKEFVTDFGRWVVEQVGVFIVVLIILLATDVKLTLLVFIPVPIVALVMSRFWRFIMIRYERQWRKESKCKSILHDIIKGIRTVKSFGNEEVEINKFSGATRELAQISSENESIWARLFPAVTFFAGIGEFLVLFFGAQMILDGQLSLGVLVQFTMYITYVYSPLRWMVSFPRVLANAMTSLIKVFEIMDEPLDITEKENAVDVPESGDITFEGVSFGYKSYEPVLKDISLNIRPGEMLGVVGRSGVGKSTLINLMMRLYDPNTGRVCIDGTDIRDMSPKRLHESIGVVFQDPFLFAGTIYDNIAYGKPGADDDEVIAASKAANAHDFIMQTPDGYNTMIGENGHSLSGGERQRLSIARAIIKSPGILILDEATSSLDVETELLIQESLGRLTKGRTTIAIAHRLSTLRSANRLIILDKGTVAESGTHTELLRKKGIYYNLVMAQRQTGAARGDELL